MRKRSLTPRDRVTGVLVGFVLVYLYWGSLLYQCGDVELNPGPGSSRQDSSMRQTSLASVGAGCRLNMDKPASNTSTSSAGENLKDPTLKDVMETLQSMNSKFDDVKEDVREMKECYASMKE